MNAALNWGKSIKCYLTNTKRGAQHLNTRSRLFCELQGAWTLKEIKRWYAFRIHANIFNQSTGEFYLSLLNMHDVCTLSAHMPWHTTRGKGTVVRSKHHGLWECNSSHQISTARAITPRAISVALKYCLKHSLVNITIISLWLGIQLVST